jgi:hypothetical protein
MRIADCGMGFRIAEWDFGLRIAECAFGKYAEIFRIAFREPGRKNQADTLYSRPPPNTKSAIRIPKSPFHNPKSAIRDPALQVSLAGPFIA